ncbi:MAG: prepilin-type N-terminal cleavage/methylation domain-containing protein [Rhodoferax sp.]|nr:prepilin-type N-terminal cleavage/methylation domain-containing protein [Rhodoferax sp.]
MNHRSLTRQSGFTLVEIAIVLVIIGLLLGGVLKGQELIDQSKIKRVVNDFNNIGAAYDTYKDRYRYVPGDDPNAATRWTTAVGGAAPANAGGGNGTITATLAQVLTGGNVEAGYVWQHLRASGLVSGDMTTAARSYTPEQTPFGSNYGFGSTVDVMGFGAGVQVFCASLPPKAAEQLDRQLDDGRPGTGKIHADAAAAAQNTAPTAVAQLPAAVYVDASANPWVTVCKKI